LQDYPKSKRESWILSWPGQVVIAVGQTYWTSSVTKAITEEETQGLMKLAVQNAEELMQEVDPYLYASVVNVATS
jgi:dynein heavy chain